MTANAQGEYDFAGLQQAKYTLRSIAKGFSVYQRQSLEITGPVTLDIQLALQVESQVINVDDELSQGNRRCYQQWRSDRT